MRLFYAALLLAVASSSALAQREPEIVIPGKPGVPVYINGIDASWGIVEGEFGLDRPNEVAPTVVYRPYQEAYPYGVPAYFPAEGRRPGYGRLEIVPPNRHPPAPGPKYYRFWSSESDPDPVTEYPPTPPMIVAPTIGGAPGAPPTNNQNHPTEVHPNEVHPNEGRGGGNNAGGRHSGP